MKHQIEIFTAGCPVCEPVVSLVKKTAGENCEITIHDLSEQDKKAISGVEEYRVSTLPSIVVDGKLLECCKKVEITEEDLLNAGIGSY